MKHVLAWECACVVSGDGGADSGVGKEWRKAQRIVEADIETNVSGGTSTRTNTSKKNSLQTCE